MKVSILMCVYNSNIELFKEVIKSIESQTYKNFEVVIVNDGSTNIDLVQYLELLRVRDRFKIHNNIKNLGLIESLNLGIELCEGEYIARFDDDDISYENRLKEQVIFLDNNKNISVLSSHEDIMDDNMDITTVRKFPQNDQVNVYMPYRCPVSHSLVMFRKKDVIDVGKYDNEYKGCEDYALWMKMINKGYQIDNIQKSLGKKKFTLRDANKRNSITRLNLMKAKIKYLSKNNINGIKGIIFSILWASLPQVIINKIYKRDIESAILLNK